MWLLNIPVINEELLRKENYLDKNNNIPNVGRGINANNLVFNANEVVDNCHILLTNKNLIKDAKEQIEILKKIRRSIYLY